MSMFQQNYDGAHGFIDKIKVAQKHEANASKGKNKSLIKAYKQEVETLVSAFVIYLQDLLCQKYRDKPVPMICTHHVYAILDKLANEPLPETSLVEKTTKMKVIDYLVEMLSVS